MKLRAAQGAAEGLWLRADRQTAGRGRLGRQWSSPSGNVYCSTLVRPKPNDPPAQSLAFVAALAVHDVMAPYCPHGIAVLKWPNDVLLAGAKACGMLLESTSEAVVVGIGINVTHAPDLPDRATAALQDFAVGQVPDASLLTRDLAHHFAERLHQWREWPIEHIYRAWCDRSHSIGTPLAVALDHETVHGEFVGLGNDGALQIRLPNGTIKTIYTGDVSLLA